jgi:hypothetical protein
MKPNAIVIAKGRLRVADGALSDLKNANSYDQFFDAWFIFLTAWKGIYTVLEQGAKPLPQSMQWFGEKAKERRSDPLLQYLFQARNVEEHGLKRSIEHGGGAHLYAVTPGQNITMQINPATGRGRGIDFDTGLPLELLNEQPPGPTLAFIKDRNGKVCAPPIIHLGNQLKDMSPIGVAEIALSYITELVGEAALLRST